MITELLKKLRSNGWSRVPETDGIVYRKGSWYCMIKYGKVVYLNMREVNREEWSDMEEEVVLPPKPFSDVRRVPMRDAEFRREEKERFADLSIEDKAREIERSRKNTKCHLYMNFIPQSILNTLDQKDQDELRRWNIIFHYQRHPHHRPSTNVEMSDIIERQTVLTRKYARHNVIIRGIDRTSDPMTGHYLTTSGREIRVRVLDYASGVWETI